MFANHVTLVRKIKFIIVDYGKGLVSHSMQMRKKDLANKVGKENIEDNSSVNQILLKQLLTRC